MPLNGTISLFFFLFILSFWITDDIFAVAFYPYSTVPFVGQQTPHTVIIQCGVPVTIAHCYVSLSSSSYLVLFLTFIIWYYRYFFLAILHCSFWFVYTQSNTIFLYLILSFSLDIFSFPSHFFILWFWVSWFISQW